MHCSVRLLFLCPNQSSLKFLRMLENILLSRNRWPVLLQRFQLRLTLLRNGSNGLTPEAAIKANLHPGCMFYLSVYTLNLRLYGLQEKLNLK